MNPEQPSGAPPREPSIWPMFAGGLLLFVVFAAGVLWMLTRTDKQALDEEVARSAERYEILAQVQEENKSLTAGYDWIDREEGLVRIPLDEAMALTVARLSAQGEPRPAYPIDPSIPLGSAVRPGGLAAPQPTPPPFDAPAAPPAESGEATEPGDEATAEPPTSASSAEIDDE
jgi:hypothetical protein